LNGFLRGVLDQLKNGLSVLWRRIRRVKIPLHVRLLEWTQMAELGLQAGLESKLLPLVGSKEASMAGIAKLFDLMNPGLGNRLFGRPPKVRPLSG
jgi:hypothetical protein